MMLQLHATFKICILSDCILWEFSALFMPLIEYPFKAYFEHNIKLYVFVTIVISNSYTEIVK